jgi:hypothetical protein
MMSDLQQRASQTRFSQHGLFDRRFGIALEHHRRSAVRHVKHQRIIIAGLRAGHVIAKRREHIQVCLAERQHIPCAQRVDHDAELACLAQQRAVGCNARVVAHPQLRRTEIP